MFISSRKAFGETSCQTSIYAIISITLFVQYRDKHLPQGSFLRGRFLRPSNFTMA
jgi:hypothetical protein